MEPQVSKLQPCRSCTLQKAAVEDEGQAGQLVPLAQLEGRGRHQPMQPMAPLRRPCCSFVAEVEAEEEAEGVVSTRMEMVED